MKLHRTPVAAALFAAVLTQTFAPVAAEAVTAGPAGIERRHDGDRFERRQDRRQDQRQDQRRDRRDRRDDRGEIRDEIREEVREEIREERREDRRRDRRADRRQDRRWDRWDDWVDYRRTVAGARLVAGMIFGTLPPNPVVVVVGSTTYHYADGVFFAPVTAGPLDPVTYQVVTAPVGAVVTTLPAGAEITVVAGVTYHRLHGVWFQPWTGGFRVVAPLF